MKAITKQVKAQYQDWKTAVVPDVSCPDIDLVRDCLLLLDHPRRKEALESLERVRAINLNLRVAAKSLAMALCVEASGEDDPLKGTPPKQE